jgi:hypothetical protein
MSITLSGAQPVLSLGIFHSMALNINDLYLKGTIAANVCETPGLDLDANIRQPAEQILWSGFPREGRVHKGYE